MSFEAVLKLVLRETNRSRPLIPLPFFVAGIIGSLAQLTTLVGLAPFLTADQVELLKTDTVVSPDAEGLDALDIQPTGVDAIAPAYLWRYRRGGQFADKPAMQDTAAATQ
mgnify:FL=1